MVTSLQLRGEGGWGHTSGTATVTWGRAAEVPAVPSDPAPGTTGALPWRNCMNSGYGKFATAASRVVVYTPCFWNLGEKVRSSSPTSVFLPALAPLPE